MARPRPQGKVLEDGTLMLFGVIGDEWDGLDARTVVDEIRSLEGDEINVLINSWGGLVDQGLAIYQELATNPARVTVDISGVAASMASAIAMAGDTVRMGSSAQFMIHDPWMVAGGTADELRKAAEMLDKLGTSLAGIYAEKTGLDQERIEEMMAEETWLSAQEALELGFVDEVVDIERAAEDLAAIDVRDLQERFSNVPAAFVRHIKEKKEMPKNQETPTPEPQPAEAVEPEEQEPVEGDERSTQALTRAEARRVAREEVQAEARVRTAIRELQAKYGLPASWADQQIERGATLEQARANALDALFEEQKNNGPSGFPPGVGITSDERDKWLAGMANWLFVKAGQRQLIERHTEMVQGRRERLDPGEYRGFSLLDIARDTLNRAGVSTRGMSSMEIAKQALRGPRGDAGLGTRSDFPLLLENVLHKLLQAAYETADDQWRSVAATGSVQDFRDHPRYRLGSLPRLETLQESGEFRQLHFPDAEKEVISAGTFGNVIGLTRQAIVNDDMDGFARLVVMLGRAAARSIDIDLFALFEANSGLGPNMRSGNALFHADHNNIASTAGTPSVETLEAARVLMAKQKDPNDNDFLNLRPAVWVGPIGLGADVRTAVNAEFDFEAGGSNPQFGKPNVVRDLLDTIVDTPRLSGDRWYVLADPAIAPVFEVVFLQGQESPQIETEEGFDFDGIRWRVRHDYGVGATDSRGAVTNAGS